MDHTRHEATILDDPAPSARPLSADPDDEYVVDLARAAADLLVSGDAHLLDLRVRLPVMTLAESLARLGGTFTRHRRDAADSLVAADGPERESRSLRDLDPDETSEFLL